MKTLTTDKLKTGEPEIFLPDDNNFPYGWRYVIEQLPDGRRAYRRVALSQADFLDPQQGDQMIQRPRHAELSIDLYNMLKNYYLADSTTHIFFDTKMVWGIAGLKEPAPDVAVVPNFKDKDPKRGIFDVVKEGARPCLVIEVISPHYPGDDTDKVEIYEQAGVTEYIIIDPHTGPEMMECKIWGYQLVGGKYQPVEPDAQGRVFSETTGLWFGVTADRYWITLTEAATGQRLLTATEEREARLEAEARTAELEARLRELEAKLKQSDELANEEDDSLSQP